MVISCTIDLDLQMTVYTQSDWIVQLNYKLINIVYFTKPSPMQTCVLNCTTSS